MRRLMLALVIMLAACGGADSTPAGPTEPPTPLPTAEAPATEEPVEPTPVPLPVEVTKVTETVSPGATASITAHTNAGASCGIGVLYDSGESTAKGLDPKKSNAKGDVTWKWLVGRKTNPQTVLVTVWCEKNGRTGVADAEVMVP
jgi:hypothetical protein